MRIYAVMASSIMDDYPYHPQPVSYHITKEKANEKLNSLDVFTDYVDDAPNGFYNAGAYVTSIEVEE